MAMRRFCHLAKPRIGSDASTLRLGASHHDSLKAGHGQQRHDEVQVNRCAVDEQLFRQRIFGRRRALPKG